MIWEKDIYNSLTRCATLCDEFATECSQAEAIESWYRGIFLSLDCADICRQVAMLYGEGSENTRLLANACIEVCGKCAQEVSRFDTERSKQVCTLCQQTIQSCGSILDTAPQAATLNTPTTTPRPVVYGINLHETLYN